MADQPTRTRLPGWCLPVAVFAAYAVVGALLHGHHFGEGLKAEDSHWIRGDFFGTPLRLTQHMLLHRVCFPLFGDNLDAYYVLTLGLHVINAALVYGVYAVLARRLGRARPRLGGALAGLLLLCYDRNNLGYVSAISYQLVVLFLLFGTLWALAYFRRGRLWVWALAVVCYGLALLTNVFALAFPLFWIPLGGIWVNQRPGGEMTRESLVIRGAMLLVPLGLLLWQHGPFLWSYEGFEAAKAEPFLQLAGQFPLYISHVVASFLWGLSGVELQPDVPAWLAALLVYGLAAWGIKQMAGRWSIPGTAAVVTLLVVLWNGLVFVQALAAQDGFSGDWRYYYGAAGMALAVAWLLMEALALAVDAMGQGRAAEAAMVLVVMAALVAINPGTRRWWSEAGDEGRTPHGRQAFECTSVAPLDQAQAAALAAPGADLSCRDLGGLDLGRSNLTGADLRGSRLALADLAGGRLARARLGWANLLWANLDGADLSGAEMTDANLFGASLLRARLIGAQISSARLAGARLEGAVMTRAVLRDADISGARLAGADLSGADLSRSLLIKSDLKNANLRGAILRGATLTQADLRGARLEAAVVDEADLQGAVICQQHRGSLKGYRGQPIWARCAP